MSLYTHVYVERERKREKENIVIYHGWMALTDVAEVV